MDGFMWYKWPYRLAESVTDGLGAERAPLKLKSCSHAKAVAGKSAQCCFFFFFAPGGGEFPRGITFCSFQLDGTCFQNRQQCLED